MTPDVVTVRKRKKLAIPRDLNLLKCWHIIGPVVAKEIAGPGYIPIPNLLDTNAYEIGHIFVKTADQTTCFGSTSSIKILGPVSRYVVEKTTNKKWHAKIFPTVKIIPNHANFKVELHQSDNEIIFEGVKYYFLSKPVELLAEKNFIIDRSSHQALSDVKWFGLIQDVVVMESFELRIRNKNIQRILQIGDSVHAVLFRYEIYKIDKEGRTKNSKVNLRKVKWQLLQSVDSLPLSNLLY